MKTFHPTDSIIGAGQPSQDDLATLKEAHDVRLVINLRGAGEDGFDADEDARVEALGMTYHHRPINGIGAIEAEDADWLAEKLGERDATALVHCKSSNRVGALLALTAHRHWDTNIEDALQLGLDAGMREQFLDTMREKLRAQG